MTPVTIAEKATPAVLGGAPVTVSMSSGSSCPRAATDSGSMTAAILRDLHHRFVCRALQVTSSARHRPVLGIAFKLGSVVLFAGMTVCVKLLGDDIPIG